MKNNSFQFHSNEMMSKYRVILLEGIKVPYLLLYIQYNNKYLTHWAYRVIVLVYQRTNILRKVQSMIILR